MDIAKVIREKRPKLNPKSVTTYASIIKSIMREMKYDDLEQLDNSKDVLDIDPTRNRSTSASCSPAL